MKTTNFLWRASQVIKPHTPMIRFRKGLTDSGHSNQGAKQGSLGGVSSKSGGPSSITIEDYQLPARFRRQPLDTYEIDAINSGGCF